MFLLVILEVRQWIMGHKGHNATGARAKMEEHIGCSKGVGVMSHKQGKGTRNNSTDAREERKGWETTPRQGHC